jgi:hypothetical protein
MHTERMLSGPNQTQMMQAVAAKADALHRMDISGEDDLDQETQRQVAQLTGKGLSKFILIEAAALVAGAGIRVVGSYTDGSVLLFSVAFNRSYRVRDVSLLTYERLIQICGPLVDMAAKGKIHRLDATFSDRAEVDARTYDGSGNSVVVAQRVIDAEWIALRPIRAAIALLSGLTELPEVGPGDPFGG